MVKESKVILSIQAYNELVEAHRHLEHLFAEGVDNWEGFSYPDEDDEDDDKDD